MWEMTWHPQCSLQHLKNAGMSVNLNRSVTLSVLDLRLTLIHKLHAASNLQTVEELLMLDTNLVVAGPRAPLQVCYKPVI